MKLREAHQKDLRQFKSKDTFEERIKGLNLDEVDIIIIGLDKYGTVKLANRKACQVFGYDMSELKEKNWFSNFIPSKLASQARATFNDIMDGKLEANVTYENPIKTKNDSQKLILWHNTIIYDSAGKKCGTLSFGEDITESRRLQKELVAQSRNSEYMYLLSRAVSDTVDIPDLLSKASNILEEYPGLLGGKLFVFGESSALKVTDKLEFGSFDDIAEHAGIETDDNSYILSMLESKINCVETIEVNRKGVLSNVNVCAYMLKTKHNNHGLFITFSENLDSTMNNFIMLVSAELGRAIKRKKVEIEIKESKEKFSAVFDLIPDALSISGIESNHFVEINKGFLELTGYEREDITDSSIGKLRLWVDQERRDQLTEKVLAENKVSDFIASIRKKNGEIIDAQLSASSLTLAGIRYMLTSARDVSDKIKFQNELLNTKELLEKISFATPGFITLYDVNNNKVIYSNRSLFESLGYSKSDLEVINKLGILSIYHPDDVKEIEVFNSNLKKMKEGELAKIDYRIKDSRSCWQWFQHSAVVFQKGNSSAPLLTVNHFENISVRKASEEKIDKQNREVQLLYEAGKQLSGTLDLSVIYDRLYKIFRQVTDTNRLAVVQYEPEGQVLIHKYLRMRVVDKRIDVSKIPPIPLARKGQGIVSEVIRTGDTMIIDDYVEYSKRAKFHFKLNIEHADPSVKDEDDQPRSAMVVPIKLNNRVLGAIQLFSAHKSAYNDDDRRFAEALMHQVALANRNATTYEQAQHEISIRKAAQQELKKSEKQIRQFAESVPDVLYRYDIETNKFTFLSPVIRGMIGYEIFEISGDPLKFLETLIHKDDLPILKKNVAEQLKHGRVEVPFMFEFRAKRKDGTEIWLRNIMKFEYVNGSLHAAIGALSDKTSEKDREAEERATDERIIRLQSCLLDLSGMYTGLEESFRLITQKVASALSTQNSSLWMFIEGSLVCNDQYCSNDNSHRSGGVLLKEDIGAALDQLKTGLLIVDKSRHTDGVLGCLVKNLLEPLGSTNAIISPIRFHGKTVGIICAESSDNREEWKPEEIDFMISVSGYATLAMESSERREAEEEIKRSLKDKEMLLREIHHRVKNNLQVIASMLYLQERKSTDPALLEGLKESQNRVKSMVMIHEKLYKSEDLASFNYSEYITELTTSLYRSYNLDTGKIRLELDIGDIILDTDTAVHCGLLINELVSNSIKHAFPNDAKGVIRISFHKNSEDMYTLSVGDSGVGLPDGAGTNKKTLGMKLIETLTNQLDGTMNVINDNGATFKIEFSLKKKNPGDASS